MNVASEDQLRRLFSALELESEVASRLAAELADWRDADTLTRPRGAESDAYEGAGRPMLPRNGPLVRIEELRDLYGMPPGVYDVLAPHLTVRGSGAVNVNTADRAVLLSVPGLDRGVVDALLRVRAQGRNFRDLDALVAAMPVALRTELVDASASLETRLSFAVREVEVESEATVQGSPVRARVGVTMTRGGGVVFVSGRRTE